ncbi:MAG: type I glutamate--ammonia ligase [Sinobacteraceae bacterium]|nr:type I glutamate--ammonia ligase [Nevskiaceae bacterium]
MSNSKALELIQETQARFVDFRFCDTLGKEQHVTMPSHILDDEFMEEGKMFDGSSIDGWKGINESDMVLMPDDDSAVLDPFFEEPTVVIRCDVLEPNTMLGYERDPRSLAKRAEAYLASTGIADTAFFGPEAEFFVFDSVTWKNEMKGAGFEIESEEGYWSSKTPYPEGNSGHRPGIKGGYFPVPPVDSHQDIRSAMCVAMENMGLTVEVHHHEVGTAGQGEIGMLFNSLVKKADELLTYKYCVTNVAHTYGKTATFMPKPLVGDNGSGMHVHQSLSKAGKNIFAGNEYGGLSKTALYYIGGIIKHAKAINAFANASTNSYKRLVKGFEAPVLLAYSAKNRSASIRIPWVSSPKGRRIEVRFPDPTANPYLAFSAMMMAGLDGIENKLDPGEAMDKDLYNLPPEEEKMIPAVAQSLEEALNCLNADRTFLLKGDVFSDDLIDAYIALKMKEVLRLKMSTHPAEFDLYYSC